MTGDVHSRNSGRPSHALTEQKRPLWIALAITSALMLVELAGGFLSGSLVLLADAGHMLTDVAAMGLSLFAFWLSSRPRTSGHTFGLRRFEIFAAFINGVALWAVSGVIAYEAVLRLKSPQPIKSGLMLAIAGLGLAANIAVGAILYRGRERNLNIRGAFLHVLADGLGSIGVLAAALLIKTTGSLLWDPIVSVGVCFLMLWNSGRLIKEAFHVFMEGAPAGLDIPGMNRALVEVAGVLDVHDLHVWTITSGFVSLSAHLTVGKGTDLRAVLRDANKVLTSRFGIRHSTLQTEEADEPSCPTGTCEGPS
jgi:cobalt-zinc-cadmium efflux system protein